MPSSSPAIKPEGAIILICIPLFLFLHVGYYFTSLIYGGLMKSLLVMVAFVLLSSVCRAQLQNIQNAADSTSAKESAPTTLAATNNVRKQINASDDGKLFIRRYPIPTGISERYTGFDSHDINETEDAAWKRVFADFGVSWPTGSSIKDEVHFAQLVVCNTRKNLDIIGHLIQKINQKHLIQIDMQFVAFDLTNIAHVAATEKINTATLTALWTSGRGELLAAPTVVTLSGAEAVVKGVTEVIYPTTVYTATNQISPGPENVKYGTPSDGFETRETGVILQVVPEVRADGKTINLTLNPQVVDDPNWHDFGFTDQGKVEKMQVLQRKQPFFHVYSTSTSMPLENGRRVLVGGGMPSHDHKRVVYLFATATLIDPRGDAIKIVDEKDEPDQPVD